MENENCVWRHVKLKQDLSKMKRMKTIFPGKKKKEETIIVCRIENRNILNMEIVEHVWKGKAEENVIRKTLQESFPKDQNRLFTLRVKKRCTYGIKVK